MAKIKLKVLKRKSRRKKSSKFDWAEPGDIRVNKLPDWVRKNREKSS